MEISEPKFGIAPEGERGRPFIIGVDKLHDEETGDEINSVQDDASESSANANGEYDNAGV